MELIEENWDAILQLVTFTKTFTFTGAHEVFVVPEGVYQITIKATGASGGGRWGGFGAEVTGTNNFLYDDELTRIISNFQFW